MMYLVYYLHCLTRSIKQNLVDFRLLLHRWCLVLPWQASLFLINDVRGIIKTFTKSLPIASAKLPGLCNIVLSLRHLIELWVVINGWKPQKHLHWIDVVVFLRLLASPYFVKYGSVYLVIHMTFFSTYACVKHTYAVVKSSDSRSVRLPCCHVYEHTAH